MLLFSFDVEDPSEHPKHHNKIKIDEEIFKRIAKNDIEAFEELYHLTERSIYAFVLSIIKNHDDALDVLQDTFLKIRSAAHLYQPMGKPMAWIFTIARNLSMSKLRTQKSVEYLHMEEISNNLSFSYVTDKEDRLVLISALTILNEQEREIILLHAISGFTHREIAQSINMPLSTVLSKYHRGLKKLRKHLIGQEVQL